MFGGPKNVQCGIGVNRNGLISDTQFQIIKNLIVH